MDNWKKERGHHPYTFKDLVDIQGLRETFEHFSQLTGFTTGLVSYPDQELLIGTGWRDICTKFHRVSPGSEVHCKQSNLDLTSKLENLQELNIRPCENGLVDGATPIIVQGMHLANLFTGQILFEKPNIQRFKKQAEKYGYNLEAYLKALNKVPVVNEKKFRNVMLFLCDMAVMLAENGLRELGLRQMEQKRKQTEKALKKSEGKFRSIFENKGTATIVFGKDSVIRECNAVFEELTGYARSDIIDTMKWSDFVVNTDLKKMQAYHSQRVSDKNHPPTQYECGVSPRYGENKSVIINLSLVGEDRIVSLTDISARKWAEEEQKKLQEQLIQAQKMEAIGTLAGGIAHDFNNLLSGIFGYSQLAEMHIENHEKAKIDIRNIIKTASRATQLVQQILTFSRKTDDEKQYFNLFVVVKEALQLIRSTIPTTIEIKEKINSKASIFADPIQMHQILINLCTNAYHAMGDSGGELTVRLDETYMPDPNNVSIINKDQKYLELEISDTGHGMDKNTIKKIFDPYFTTKTREKGTGLGLATVRAIVMGHGGSISVNSTLGRGSSFLIYLPIAEQKNSTPIKSTLDKKIPRGTESILFVEDEEDIRFSIQEFIESHGYRLTVCENGQSAYEKFKQAPQNFDIVITDMAMPKMNGDELALKILKIRKDIPIILCTGYSEKLNAKQAKKIGITRYINKPIAGQELCFLIREVLNKGKNGTP